jgi:hypothetical protein
MGRADNEQAAVLFDRERLSVRSLAGHRNQKAKEICYGQGDL